MTEVQHTQPTVLVIEDEEDLLASLEYSLQQEGYTTRSALNGEDGLRRAHETPRPDLILLDIMLPGVPVPRCASNSSKILRRKTFQW